ncbi:P-loop ATPase, Sll1717 family [Pleomorphomonas sp. T1.2MG-36]|uniref:P-loop ATPase, Sll1717 family n=1 Tax=Pleomorphomonas sp. T1.2MG-36 TaxID=3041167 RepID=UPI00253FADD4|nr:hypothetical protein [Pleomorphomonas sp. T1.2MG-36]
MIIEFGTPSSSQPADFRDLVVTLNSETDIFEKVKEFCGLALLATQEPQPKRRRSASKLQALSLGASAAENEFRLLENYFVETSEYVRTLRGEVSVVSGRKGSGKTAIFFMVRDAIRSKKFTSVTDLKPESHQLSLFRQELLKLLDIGVFDHTLAAFWYFVFLTEMLFTIQRENKYKLQHDPSALSSLSDIEDVLQEFGIINSGDFTARINRLSKTILFEISSAKTRNKPLSPESLTNIVFRGGINKIKQLIIKNTTPKTRIVLLFDNIDRGWPTQGVEEFDVRMIRLMVESLEKIRRDLHNADRDMFSVVFLRNDIYELLVEQTPDRGKVGQIRIDWNDPVKLRTVILKRLQASTAREGDAFSSLWLDYFAPTVGGVDSFEYCVSHCLMRPRFLLTIIENAIANAINRSNTIASEDDIADAVKQHSNYLISEFGFEIRDASGLSADILFELIGLPEIVSKEMVLERFSEGGIPRDKLEHAFQLMLWYGVIGFVKKDGDNKYIYDYDYSMKRLAAEMRHIAGEPQYSINPALMAAIK